MACGDLPEVPDVKIPNPIKAPNVSTPSFNFNVPEFGLPPLLTNWHPNLFDILILLWLIMKYGSGAETAGALNDVGKKAAIADMLGISVNQQSGDSIDIINIPPSIIIDSLSPLVFPYDKNLKFEMINRRYDEVTDSILELVFGYVDDDLRADYKNYIFDNRTMRRV